jgi:hypothetical protein
MAVGSNASAQALVGSKKFWFFVAFLFFQKEFYEIDRKKLNPTAR